MAVAPHDDKDDKKETAHPASHPEATRTPPRPAATTTAAAPRDAAADQSKLLLLLAADWLNNDRTHAAEIAALLTGLTAGLGPPVNVDVPAVTQSGAVLNCTMGNWHGAPTAYAYAWCVDGVANGSTGAVYTVQPGDSGHGVACVITATNAMGSTVAPMSNAITIA